MAATCDCCGRRWDGCKTAAGECQHCGEPTGGARWPLCSACEAAGACPGCGALEDCGYAPAREPWEPSPF